jgi:hypothetical protein
MPHLSAASRLAFPLRPAFFIRPRWLPSACADPRPPGDDALQSAESQDTLLLGSPETKAETTTVHVGTLRVVAPGGNAQSLVESSKSRPKPDPPACSFEC